MIAALCRCIAPLVDMILKIAVKREETKPNFAGSKEWAECWGEVATSPISQAY